MKVATRRRSCLGDKIVRAALKQAWEESNPGSSAAHEEGGFILRDAEGIYRIVRWERGAKDTIKVPPHPGCRLDSKDIAASFHTHPNTGLDYLQEPSETDKRAVRDDANLKGEYFEGEFVISSELLYLVTIAGTIREIGETADILLSSEV